MTPLYVTIPDAVAFTSMSRSAIYEALKDGRLTAKKSGRRTLLSVADLRAYMENLPDISL